MKVTAYLADGAELKWADFNAETMLDLRDALDGEPFLTFEMDDATVIVNRDHLVRLDVES